MKQWLISFLRKKVERRKEMGRNLAIKGHTIVAAQSGQMHPAFDVVSQVRRGNRIVRKGNKMAVTPGLFEKLLGILEKKNR